MLNSKRDISGRDPDFTIDREGWRRWDGKLAWKIELHELGARVHVEGEPAAPRTVGAPRTMETLWADFGCAIEEASERWGVPKLLIASMLSIEAAKIRGTFHFDPTSTRYEPKTRTRPAYSSDEETPERVSYGLMQTLLSTARGVERRQDVMGHRITKRVLFIPSASIQLGTAYLHELGAREDTLDPVYMCGAYNAGDARDTDNNPFGIMTYGEGRIIKMIRYWNDLDATGLVGPDPLLEKWYGREGS